MKPILLNTRDAAALCGVTIKRWRTWNALGKIPAPLRIGNACFWKHDELIDWIDEGCPTRKYWAVILEKRLGKGLHSPRNRR